MDRKEEIRQKLREYNEQVFQLEKELDDILKKENTKEEYEILKNFQFEVVSKNIFIIRGGLGYPYPRSESDKIINKIFDKLGVDDYMDFIESSLDNPWVRVIIFNTKELKFEDTFNDVIKKLK